MTMKLVVMPSMRPAFLMLVTLPFLCALLNSCCNESIQTYQVPKESAAAAISMMPSDMGGMGNSSLPPDHPAIGQGMAASSDAKEASWKVPEGWEEQPLSSMRVGSFLIKGANGQLADMSVVPLSGEAGGDLPNINRWRGQINLGPISDADLSAQSESISPAGRKMLYIDFVSHEPLINNQYKKRLMAAIYHREGRTWFFKMTGEDATVLSAKPAFIHFLKSLKFNEN